jgi:hypothetical protein
MDWKQNRLTCCSLGMEPLLIENGRELACLSNLTKSGNWTGNFNYWTSGTQKDIGNWTWCGKDGATVLSADVTWDKGQPDNKGGHEDCIHLKLKKNNVTGHPQEFVLTDRNCTDKYIMACKVNDDSFILSRFLNNHSFECEKGETISSKDLHILELQFCCET